MMKSNAELRDEDPERVDVISKTQTATQADVQHLQCTNLYDVVDFAIDAGYIK